MDNKLVEALFIGVPVFIIIDALIIIYVRREKKKQDSFVDHNLHMEIHQQKMKEIMVLDPLKYRGKGRPRKSDYSSVFEIQNRQIEAHLLRIRTYR